MPLVNAVTAGVLAQEIVTYVTRKGMPQVYNLFFMDVCNGRFAESGIVETIACPEL